MFIVTQKFQVTNYRCACVSLCVYITKGKINRDLEIIIILANLKIEIEFLHHCHVIATFHFLPFFSHNDGRAVIIYFAKTIYRKAMLHNLML